MQKYKTCFVMGIQKAFEYRFDFFIGYFSAIFPIIIQVSMWTAIYHSTHTGMLYGYSYKQMILYTFFVGIIGRFLATGFEYEMNDDIKNGGLNKFIVKPVNYCFYRSACFLGERASVSIVFLAILLFFAVLFGIGGYFEVTIIRVLCFFISLILSLLLNFSVYFCIGILGLWMNEISRVFPAISIVLSVLSGSVFPLDILGDGMNQIIFFLPFKYLLQFPVDLITGKQFGYSILLALLVQAVWAIIIWGIAQILWKKGMRKYIAVGG